MTLSDQVGRINHTIEHLQGGDIAELRRLRPSSPSAPAFWKLVASEDIRDDPEEERRWAVIVSALATLRGLHRPGHSLGRSLKDAETQELRVLQLLRAHGPGLETALRRLVQLLRSKGQALDCTDIARLVLSDGRNDEEAVRRRIARHFYS